MQLARTGRAARDAAAQACKNGRLGSHPSRDMHTILARATAAGGLASATIAQTSFSVAGQTCPASTRRHI